MSNKCLICSICDRVVTEYDEETVKVARRWGFFVCGMGRMNHLDENFIRKTILVNKHDKIERKGLFTGATVPLTIEVGM